MKTPEEIKRDIITCLVLNRMSRDQYETMRSALLYIGQLEKSVEFARDLSDGLKKATVEQEREIENLKSSVPRWISVKERLPKVKGSYLVCGKHWIAGSEPITTIHYWWGNSWAQSTVFEITHWMPLPEAPKEE